MTSSGASIAVDEIKCESHDRPRDLEDIRDTLRVLSKRPRVVKNIRDREGLSKCSAIIEQRFQTFQVIRGSCPIIIIFFT